MSEYSEEKAQAIERFMKEKSIYSNECSIFQKFRISIPEKKEQRTEAQNKIYDEHRKRLREAERIYREEIVRFANIVNPSPLTSAPKVVSKEDEAVRVIVEEYKQMLLGLTPSAAQEIKEKLKTQKEFEKAQKKIEKKINPQKESVYNLPDYKAVMRGLNLPPEEKARYSIPAPSEKDSEDIDAENEKFLEDLGKNSLGGVE